MPTTRVLSLSHSRRLFLSLFPYISLSLASLSSFYGVHPSSNVRKLLDVTHSLHRPPFQLSHALFVDHRSTSNTPTTAELSISIVLSS